MSVCVSLMLVSLSAPASAADTFPIQSHANPILHSFPASADIYPESVTVDQTTGTSFVGSVKEGTIFKGKVGRLPLKCSRQPAPTAASLTVVNYIVCLDTAVAARKSVVKGVIKVGTPLSW
jgi:hypothetical protein